VYTAHNVSHAASALYYLVMALFEITLQNIVAVDKSIAVEEQTSELLWTMSVYDIHNVILHNAAYSAKIQKSYFKTRYRGL